MSVFWRSLPLGYTVTTLNVVKTYQKALLRLSQCQLKFVVPWINLSAFCTTWWYEYNIHRSHWTLLGCSDRSYGGCNGIRLHVLSSRKILLTERRFCMGLWKGQFCRRWCSDNYKLSILHNQGWGQVPVPVPRYIFCCTCTCPCTCISWTGSSLYLYLPFIELLGRS